jgi:hypothetical protein
MWAPYKSSFLGGQTQIFLWENPQFTTSWEPLESIITYGHSHCGGEDLLRLDQFHEISQVGSIHDTENKQQKLHTLRCYVRLTVFGENSLLILIKNIDKQWEADYGKLIEVKSFPIP